jgi:hypothetical protein
MSSLRSWSRPPKYNADPTEVRSAEGTVPRQRERKGVGEVEIARRAVVKGWAMCAREDCWTRVLRRSKG